MAVDLCNASPRISFSHDLCISDTSAAELPRADSLLMESNDFDFCIGDSFEQDSFASCADELFSDGKILPQEIKKQQVLPPKPPKKDCLRADEKPEKPEKHEKLAPSISASASTSSSSSASSASPKSLFWRLTRSSSCGNGYTRSLICNLPLLSRSNSTGSAPKTNSKNLNSNSTKTTAGNTKLSSSSSSSFYPYSTTSSKRSYGSKNNGSKNNGIRVNPILNVPPPYISRGTVNLFGFGSLFCHGKDKEKNKKKRSAMVN